MKKAHIKKIVNSLEDLNDQYGLQVLSFVSYLSTMQDFDQNTALPDEAKSIREFRKRKIKTFPIDQLLNEFKTRVSR